MYRVEMNAPPELLGDIRSLKAVVIAKSSFFEAKIRERSPVRFYFATETHRIAGMIFALEELACSACLNLSIRSGQTRLLGKVKAWDFPSAEVSDLALTRVLLLTERLAARYPRGIFTVEFSIQRILVQKTEEFS